MTGYDCSTCGMSVDNLGCKKCGQQLQTAEGVSKCPQGCGMIKSPQCCGSDMKASQQGTATPSVASAEGKGDEYTCNKCGMGVKGIRCGKCGTDLKHEKMDMGGKQVSVASCGQGHGQIKSPMCCGQDMVVSASA